VRVAPATRLLGAVSVLVLLAVAARAEPPAAKVLSLRAAVEKRLVSVRGVDPGSYRSVTLEIANRSCLTLEVDLCGSFLEPEARNACQRLGLGPLCGSPERTRRNLGAVLVELRPLETRRLEVRTVCLDAGRPAPNDQVFTAATEPLPPVREKVLRWWALHPDTCQSRVNEAIWQNRETVRTGASTRVASAGPRGKHVAARGGAVYMLRDGELTAMGPDGTTRFLGTCIRRVFPTPRGLYAVGYSQHGAPELWVHEQTGERPWRRVCGLGSEETIHDVVTVPLTDRSWLRNLPERKDLVAGLLLVTADGICAVERSRWGTDTRVIAGTRGCDPETRPVGKKSLQITIERAGHDNAERGGRVEKPTSPHREIGEIDLRTGRVAWTRRFWNLESLAMGEGGIFARTAAGSLKRDDGKRFRIFGVGRRHTRIVGVERRLAWVVLEGGVLAAVDVRTGQTRRIRNVPVPYGSQVDVDPITDDLVLVAEDRFVRIAARDGRIETVR
jgi:hypothetical protein